MRIPMSLIESRLLQQKFWIKKCSDRSRKLVGVTLYTPGDENRLDDQLIVCMDGVPSQMNERNCFLVPEKSCPNAAANVTVVTRGEMIDAFKSASNLFRMMGELEKDLGSKIYSDTTVDDLLRIGSRILGNPIAAYNRGGHAVASTDSNAPDSLPASVAAAAESAGTGNSFLVTSAGSEPLLGCVIPGKEEPMGTLLLSMSQRRLGDEYYCIFETLAGNVGFLMDWQQSAGAGSAAELAVTLPEALLTRNSPSPESAADLKKRMGWDDGGCYKVLAVEAETAGGAGQFPASLVASSLSSLGSACSCVSDGRLVFLVKGDVGNRDAFLSLLSSNGLRAGSSLPFTDLASCGSYYAQAVRSLSLGSGTVTSYEGHFLDELMADYLSAGGNGEGMLPFVKKLAASDRNGMFRKTLLAYASSDKSYAYCCSLFGINKSTLKYRLDRIASLDPTESYLSPDLRGDLILSLKMSLRGDGIC